MEEYKSKDQYLQALEKRGLLPEGFKTSTKTIEFKAEERDTAESLKMDLTLISLDNPTELFAGVFTKNAFPGYPVEISRQLIKGDKISGVLINNRISNVRCSGGRNTALKITDELQRLSGFSSPYFPSSTGIIGWKLPEMEICSNLENLVNNLNKNSLLKAAQAIMTTDAFPKIRSAKAGDGIICGIAKGAGMIEPNMATMLVFILTDINIKRDDLNSIFAEVTNKTFNRISVDSDQSTSDTAIIFSSGIKECTHIDEFKKALYSVCSSLSEDIVRNGEGTSHMIRVKVLEAENEKEASELGKALVNSPLTKTAIFGNDPNVGRFLQAMGDYLGTCEIAVDPELIKISIGDYTVFENGIFTLDKEKEDKLSNYMKDCSFINSGGYPPHDRSVDLFITLGRGSAESEILGSDLTYEYVRENADYRT